MRKACFALLVLFVLIGSGCRPKTITAADAISFEIDNSQATKTILETMASAYAKYLTYQSSDEDFKNEVLLLKKQYDTMEQNSERFFKKYKIDEATMNEAARKALEELKKAREAVGNILNGTVVNGKIISRSEIYSLYAREIAVMDGCLRNFKAIIGESASK